MMSRPNEAVAISDPTIREAIAEGVRILRDLDCAPRLETEVLLGHVLGQPRTHLHAWPERLLSRAQWRQFTELLEQRHKDVPSAYLTGCREFWDLQLTVTPATLIPRPETELLVELALRYIPPMSPWRIADLGTGCGAIALALARERPHAHLIATDNSREALRIAQQNARRYGLHNMEFRPGWWCQAVPAEMRLDLLVSNPPYLRAADPHFSLGLRHEPRVALEAGPDGLEALAAIAQCALGYLKPGGKILLEHGYDQRYAVERLLRAQGYVAIQCLTDLAGHDRVTEATAPCLRSSK